MPSTCKVRANCKMGRAIFRRGSKMVTTFCPRSQISWKPGGASSKVGSAQWKPRANSAREEESRVAEEAAINLVIESLRPQELRDLIAQAVAALPEPIVRWNPTLTNPFLRAKVYELACGEPLA